MVNGHPFQYTIRWLMANTMLLGIAFALLRALTTDLVVAAVVFVPLCAAIVSGNYGIATEQDSPIGDRLLLFACYAGMGGILCFMAFTLILCVVAL